MTVADWAGTLVDWKAELEALKQHIAPALGRAETRQSAGAFIDGLLSSAERKTGWMLAEEAGLARPTGSSRCSAAAGGRPRLCAIGCAAMWPRRSATPTASWSSTRPAS